MKEPTVNTYRVKVAAVLHTFPGVVGYALRDIYDFSCKWVGTVNAISEIQIRS